MKRGGRLNPRSKKRRERDKTALPWRRRQVKVVGQCERCNARYGLIVHEILRGTSGRRKAYDKGFATLVVCHPKCHDEVGRWPQPKQLALLKLRRPGEYDLTEFNTLADPDAPNRITQEEVDACESELLLIVIPAGEPAYDYSLPEWIED